MFISYRIHPVVETQGPEVGDITRERFISLSGAEQHIREWEDSKTSFSGVEGKSIYWTLYGLHPEELGANDGEAIADRPTLAECQELLSNIIGTYAIREDGSYYSHRWTEWDFPPLPK